MSGLHRTLNVYVYFPFFPSDVDPHSPSLRGTTLGTALVHRRGSRGSSDTTGGPVGTPDVSGFRGRRGWRMDPFRPGMEPSLPRMTFPTEASERPGLRARGLSPTDGPGTGSVSRRGHTSARGRGTSVGNTSPRVTGPATFPSSCRSPPHVRARSVGAPRPVETSAFSRVVRSLSLFFLPLQFGGSNILFLSQGWWS